MKRIIPMLVLALQGCPVDPGVLPAPLPTSSASPQPQYLAATAQGRPYLLVNELHLVTPDGTDKLMTSWEREAGVQYVEPNLRFVLLATGGRLVAKRVDGGERKDLLAYGEDGSVLPAPDGKLLAVRSEGSLYLVDPDAQAARPWVKGLQVLGFKWAATGKALAYVERSNAIYVTRPDQDQPTLVATPTGNMEFFALTPDLERVVTTWYHDKYAGIVEIRTFAVADGKETKQVVDVSGGQGPGVAHAEARDLTADGTRLIADLFRPDAQGGRIAIDLANGTWTKVTE